MVTVFSIPILWQTRSEQLLAYGLERKLCRCHHLHCSHRPLPLLHTCHRGLADKRLCCTDTCWFPGDAQNFGALTFLLPLPNHPHHVSLVPWRAKTLQLLNSASLAEESFWLTFSQVEVAVDRKQSLIFREMSLFWYCNRKENNNTASFYFMSSFKTNSTGAQTGYTTLCFLG